MINVTVLSLLLRLNFPRGKMNCVFFSFNKTSQTKKNQNTKTPPKIPQKIKKLTTETTLKKHQNEEFFLN